MKKAFEKFKAWSENLVGDHAPWWVVPVGIVVALVIIF